MAAPVGEEALREAPREEEVPREVPGEEAAPGKEEVTAKVPGEEATSRREEVPTEVPGEEEVTPRGEEAQKEVSGEEVTHTVEDVPTEVPGEEEVTLGGEEAKKEVTREEATNGGEEVPTEVPREEETTLWGEEVLKEMPKEEVAPGGKEVPRVVLGEEVAPGEEEALREMPGKEVAPGGEEAPREVPEEEVVSGAKEASGDWLMLREEQEVEEEEEESEEEEAKEEEEEEPGFMQQKYGLQANKHLIQTVWQFLKNLSPEVLRQNKQFCRELGTVFLIAGCSNREEIPLCIYILERIFQVLDPVYIIRYFWDELQKGLYHPFESFKILILAQIGRILEDPEAVTDLVNMPELLREAIFCIAAENRAVAEAAITSLSRVAITSHGLEALLTGSLLADLKSIMFKNYIVRYRVYELIINISSVSVDSLNYCVNSGLLLDLIWDLIDNSANGRAICIEMVTSLIYTPHVRHYLIQEGIIDKISDIIIEAELDPFSDTYLPGFLKFFAVLAVVDGPQQICERFPVFVDKVFSMAEGQDPNMFGVAVDTLSIIGSNVDGKIALQKMGSRFQYVLNRIGIELEIAPTDLRVWCLDSIAALLYLPSDQQTEDLLQMTEYWFSCLSEQPLELLWSISIESFSALHCSTLQVFTAIANQPWAQQMMVAFPGFVKYLMDRSEEPDRVSKEAKYELVEALTNSETIVETFGNQYYLQLQEYLREKPSSGTTVETTFNEGAEFDSPSTSGSSGKS